MNKIVINLDCFGVININEIEKPMLILFEDNKIFIQLRKDIFNIRKIKYINTTFYEIKDKSRKDIIFMQLVSDNPMFNPIL